MQTSTEHPSLSVDFFCCKGAIGIRSSSSSTTRLTANDAAPHGSFVKPQSPLEIELSQSSSSSSSTSSSLTTSRLTRTDCSLSPKKFQKNSLALDRQFYLNNWMPH